MLKIDKKQREYLIKNGVGLSDIHHTTGHHKNYYVTYNQKVADVLEQYNKERIITK